jgi:hypothetical protein
MGTSDQPSRSKVLAGLAGFVVVFGAVSWFVTGGIGFHGAPPTHSHPATFTPEPTPTPLVCASNELALTGVFNECTTAVPDKTSCSVHGEVFDALLRFVGSNQAFLLYIEVNGGYTYPGKYDLPPWPFGLGTKNDVPKVAVRQVTTGAFWQSFAGVLTVTGGDGRSGTVNAILQTFNGTTVVPGPTLSVDGPWACP